MEITFRRDAKRLGKKKYYTGKLCKHGHKSLRRTATGKCIECERLNQLTDKQKEYHRKLKKTSKYREMAKRYRNNNPEAVAASARMTHIKSKYGLSKDEYNQLLVECNHKCSICGSGLTGNNLPCVDHCHTTSTVRGIICHSCNKMLGFAKDDIQILKQAIRYLS